jgi:hypothetical protein
MWGIPRSFWSHLAGKGKLQSCGNINFLKCCQQLSKERKMSEFLGSPIKPETWSLGRVNPRTGFNNYGIF